MSLYISLGHARSLHPRDLVFAPRICSSPDRLTYLRIHVGLRRVLPGESYRGSECGSLSLMRDPPAEALQDYSLVFRIFLFTRNLQSLTSPSKPALAELRVQRGQGRFRVHRHTRRADARTARRPRWQLQSELLVDLDNLMARMANARAPGAQCETITGPAVLRP